MIGTWSGYRIVEDPNLVDIVEDWSQVRSPSRARRRRAKHRQRIVVTRTPKPGGFILEAQRVIVMHPTVAAQARTMLDKVSKTGGNW